MRELVARRNEGSGQFSIELNNNVDIEILTNNFRSVRGRTILCAILDENAYFRDETGANPDFELYESVMPGLGTLPNSLLIGISTAYRKAGLLYSKFVENYAQNDDDTLVVHGSSYQFNPSLDPRILERALKRDKEKAEADYLSIWRSDISEFLGRDIIENAVDSGVVVRPPEPGINYKAFCDSASGVAEGDSFTLAIAHRVAPDKAVVDCLVEWRAPFSPTAVCAEAADLLRSYNLGRITGDRYSANWVVEAFRACRITYIASELDRSAIYENAIPLFSSGRARILDSDRLVKQFQSLERHSRVGGRDRIDHAANANSCAGALVACVSGGQIMTFSDSFLARSKIPLPRIRNRDIPTFW